MPAYALALKVRTGSVEGQAVLRVIHCYRGESVQRRHAQVDLVGLYVACAYSVYVDGGMGAAEAPEADGLEACGSAVITRVNAGCGEEYGTYIQGMVDGNSVCA